MRFFISDEKIRLAYSDVAEKNSDPEKLFLYPQYFWSLLDSHLQTKIVTKITSLD